MTCTVHRRNGVGRLRTAVVCALVAFVLPGCQMDQTTTGSPTPSPSTTHSAEPSPSPRPSFPEVAKAKTDEGAIAFTDYYYDLVKYGHQAREWKPLRDVTLDTCGYCQTFWEGPQRWAPDESVYAEVGSPSSKGIENGGTSVVVIIDAGAGLDGPLSESHQRSKIESQWSDKVDLNYTENGWRVEEIHVDRLLPYHS